MDQLGSGANLHVAKADESDNLDSYINLFPPQLAADGLTAAETNIVNGDRPSSRRSAHQLRAKPSLLAPSRRTGPRWRR